ncbi:hypothetical protein J9303_06350 [Bacillaceae bacterium Marseille-Q3522]|nr:hypothetical protein [Bacillaceae bacterium Marseille-Q3522]
MQIVITILLFFITYVISGLIFHAVIGLFTKKNGIVKAGLKNLLTFDSRFKRSKTETIVRVLASLAAVAAVFYFVR